ncbi:hypothetical protein [Kurthia senegalensis]|uniref:hypothetical protein n=1 Tax=Kurthia senegalensis TaxID=1033740 RepID=UPI000288E24E|nr:hypothetical protein [Kurthia senegalensis]
MEMLVIIFLIIIILFIVVKPKRSRLSNEKQLFLELQQQLWGSYKQFSIRSQNDIFEKHLHKEVREKVVETKQLPEQLVDEIRQFHESLQKEIMMLKQQQTDIGADCLQLFIAYMEARYIFLNKEWAYMRAILQSDAHALEATQLYRKARDRQQQQYRDFETCIKQQTKNINV